MAEGGHSLDRVRATLQRVGADIERHAHRPVIVIGSAAACLAGADVDVADLDLLTDAHDAERLRQVWAAHRVDGHAPDDDDRFRSRFSRYCFGGMPVEIMGQLEVRFDNLWQRLTIDDTMPIPGQSAAVRMPTIAEQLRVLELFDRPKDRLRAERLRRPSQLPGEAA